MGRATYRKIITSPQKIANINTTNKRLVERFLKSLSARRSSETVKVYKSNLNIFFCWNLEYNDNKIFIDIKKIEFIDFFNYALSELRWGNARYSQMRSTLNSFSVFIEDILDEEYPLFRNQIKKIETRPKLYSRQKTVLTIEQLIDFLFYLESKQEACFIALLASSGIRVSESFQFTTDLIDEDTTICNGVFLETTHRIQTKGNKFLYKYILKNLFLPYYKDWLPLRNQILKENGQNHNYIFIKNNGTPATISTVRSWNRKWNKYFDEPFYPHCLRHFLCTYLAKNNIPQELIVELFGWTSSNMYYIYNDLTVKDKYWKELEGLKGEKYGKD